MGMEVGIEDMVIVCVGYQKPISKKEVLLMQISLYFLLL
jgi:hypothetical protein